MSGSLNWGPFLGGLCIRVPYYIGDPNRDPDLENYPNPEPKAPSRNPKPKVLNSLIIPDNATPFQTPETPQTEDQRAEAKEDEEPPLLCLGSLEGVNAGCRDILGFEAYGRPGRRTVGL